jgi:hypothetical protein
VTWARRHVDSHHDETGPEARAAAHADNIVDRRVSLDSDVQFRYVRLCFPQKICERVSDNSINTRIDGIRFTPPDGTAEQPENELRLTWQVPIEDHPS